MKIITPDKHEIRRTRITGDWLPPSKSDHQEVVAAVWPKLELELEELGYRFCGSDFTMSMSSAAQYQGSAIADKEVLSWPEEPLRDTIKKQISANRGSFLANSLRESYPLENHPSGMPSTNIRDLRLHYSGESYPISFRVTPRKYYGKPNDFAFLPRSLSQEEMSGLVVSAHCGDNHLERNIRGLYRALRKAEGYKYWFNENLKKRIRGEYKK